MNKTGKAPSDFEWVHARAACSPAKVFEQLKIQIAHDVELRNEMGKQLGQKFDMHAESSGIAFAVFLDSTFHRETPHRVVRFYLEGHTIIAQYGDETNILSAAVTLNDEGECRLRIGDKSYALWQVRHMALEKLFFGIVRPS